MLLHKFPAHSIALQWAYYAPLLLCCSNSHNDVPSPALQRNVSIAQVRGAVPSALFMRRLRSSCYILAHFLQKCGNNLHVTRPNRLMHISWIKVRKSSSAGFPNISRFGLSKVGFYVRSESCFSAVRAYLGSPSSSLLWR